MSDSKSWINSSDAINFPTKNQRMNSEQQNGSFRFDQIYRYEISEKLVISAISKFPEISSSRQNRKSVKIIPA
jgi:hypothetical protein